MRIQFYFFLFILFFTACGKEDVQEIIQTEGKEIFSLPSKEITSSIFGRIKSKNGTVIADAEITIGNFSTKTNNQGFFHFNNLIIDKYNTLISAKKSGFIHGIRKIMLHENTSSFYEIVLSPNTPEYNFNPKEKSTIKDKSGIELYFSPNSISKGNENFEGNVNVSIAFIDPSESYLYQRIPGNLEGINIDGDYVALKSFSMIYVELTDDLGDLLKISDGYQVEIKFPIPASMLNQAPVNIPLWYLHEETGIWKEEGSAHLEGNHFVGNVSHFSFWNCDIPEEAALIEGQICLETSENCEPLSYYSITILDEFNQIRGIAQTDSLGNFSSLVPKGIPMKLGFNEECLNGTLEIDPLTENKYLGLIDVSKYLRTVKINAAILDCNGSMLESGFVFINNKIIVPVKNGRIDKQISICESSQINVIAANNEFLNLSKALTLNYSNEIKAMLHLCVDVAPKEFGYVFVTNDSTQKHSIFKFLPSLRTTCRESIEKRANEQGDTITTIFAESEFLFNGLQHDGKMSISIDHGNSCLTNSDEYFISGVGGRVQNRGLWEIIRFSGTSIEWWQKFASMTGETVSDESLSNFIDLITDSDFFEFGSHPGENINGTIKIENATISLRESNVPTIESLDEISNTIHINFNIYLD